MIHHLMVVDRLGVVNIMNIGIRSMICKESGIIDVPHKDNQNS